MTDNNLRDDILKRLHEKSSTKFKVYDTVIQVFNELKEEAKLFVEETKLKLADEDRLIPIDYKEKSQFEFELKIAGDMLVVTMHTNIFEFPDDHFVKKSSYVKEDPLRSYCGVIRFYNFLADSFKYNRMEDVGYLIGRMFINKDKHFFVEGQRQFRFLYNDIVNDVVSKSNLNNILESVILYCIDFDLFAPPYDNVKEVSVGEIHSIQSSISLKTGKRLGFQFLNDSGEIK
jgi:hypothetical protein